MNKSFLFGLGIAAAVLYVSVFQHTKFPLMFFHPNSIILVLGGTFAVAFIAFPFASLVKVFDYLLWGFLFRKKKEYLKVSQDIAGARAAFQNSQNFTPTDNSHPFFKESAVLLSNENISNQGFEQILRQRSEYFKKKYKDDAKLLISLSKYPPAFGLLGGAIGMIELMSSIQTATSINIGSSMMLAFVSTFWGIAFSHFVLLPLADSAAKSVEDDHILRSLIIDGMILIRENVNDEHFQAYMRGYLSLSDRSEFKIQSKKSILGYIDQFKSKTKNNLKTDETEQLGDLLVSGPDLKVPPYPPPPENSHHAPNSPQPILFRRDHHSPKITDPNETVKAVVGSDVNPIDPIQPPDPTQITMTSTLTRNEQPGRVEEPIKLKQNIEINPQQFKFKDLRKEMKKLAKK